MVNAKSGVVILNYNSHDLTKCLAEKVGDMPSVDAVCVVDNNSNDDFEGEFSHPKIHYIKNNRNAGYSAGNNVGLRYLIEECGCEFVFIANPDVIFEDSTINNMVQIMMQDSKIALVSTKRFGPNNAILHQYFDFPTLSASIKSCFFLTRRKFERNRHAIQNYRVDNANGPVYVDAVPGAFFGIKSEFLKRNNYIYEGIFLYGEEIILGRQAHNMGYRACVINTDVYIHNHKQVPFSNRKMFYLDRQSLKVYYKLFEKHNWIQRLMLDVAIELGTFEYNCMYFLYHLFR